MIDESLKQDVLELAGIAKACPDNLQEKCFEIILTDYLGRLVQANAVQKRGERPASPEATGEEKQDQPVDPEVLDSGAPQSESDLIMKDLHIKAKRFLEKYSLTLADLNQILYKEGDELRPLYEDLKTNKGAESQIRIGLLQALISGIKSGDFEFSGETVRKECQERKCYDGGNFSTNFKNNAALFDGFEKYDSKKPIIRLSDDGRQALAKAIGELR
jgi:hypothetical protein